MNSASVLWGYFVLFCLIGLVFLSSLAKRYIVLAIWGMVVVFFSPLLADFVAAIVTERDFDLAEVSSEWLFSFRATGLCLFAWGMCDGIGEALINGERSWRSESDRGV